MGSSRSLYGPGQHEVRYPQVARLIAHRELARRLERQPLVWCELNGLAWILGPGQAPMMEPITDFFLRARVKAPPPFVETLFLAALPFGQALRLPSAEISAPPERII